MAMGASSPYWSRELKLKAATALLSLLAGGGLVGLKFYVYRMTGSSAVLSDALESIINVAASGFALVSVLFSALPPDEDHPYGHGKIEFFSAGFEGALILLAAAGIFAAGIGRLMEPRPLPHLDTGLALLLGASGANLLLGLLLLRVGERTRSLTLKADGKHVLTDVLTSAGVLVGLLLVRFTGWLWLDGLVACLVGVQILVTGFRLVHEAYGGLMDRSDPLLLERIGALLAENRKPQWVDIHRLRAWRAGSFVHIDFHLVLPQDYSLVQAHREVEALERLLGSSFEGDASVMIHTDPCEEDVCSTCGKSLCHHRRQEQARVTFWSREALTKIVPEDR
jgi:cation diffusion facilitator family transporter